MTNASRRCLIVAVLLGLLGSCHPGACPPDRGHLVPSALSEASSEQSCPTPPPVAPGTGSPRDASLPGPGARIGPADASAVVTILATSDVHGWMAPRIDTRRGAWEGGLEPLVAAWETREGIDLDARARGDRGGVLIVDSGDMWTGPPVSTLTQGRPVVDIYNAVGYDAVAVGNHEFDFGIDNLRDQAGRARFPFLAANVTSPDGSVDVSFLQGHALVEVSGVRIGVIGLAFRDTPVVSFPPNIAGLAFGDYESALRVEARRLLEQERADMLVVLVHDGIEALRALADATADLPVRVFFGGHTHRAALEVVARNPETVADDVVLAVPRSKARHYTRVTLTFQARTLMAHTETQARLRGSLSDGPYPSSPAVAAIRARAEEAVGPALDEVVGVAREPIEVGDSTFSPLGVLVAESWLEQVPSACLAVTNIGGIRQPLDAGEVTAGDILGVLPFANHLVVTHLTGKQIASLLSNPLLVAGGITLNARVVGDRRQVNSIYLAGGRRLDADMICDVVTTDFLYAGGDGATFAAFDPDPRWLDIGWRDPVVALFRDRGRAGVSAPRPPPPPRAVPGGS